MKKKLFIFVVLLSFIITTLSCSTPAVEAKRPDPVVPITPNINREVAGLYQTANGRWTLLLHPDYSFSQHIISLGHGDVITGTYSFDNFSHLVLESEVGDRMISFNIERNPNGQIDRLIEVLIGDEIFNRIPPINTNIELVVGEYAADNNNLRLSLDYNGLYHLVSANDNLELLEHYYINEFGLLMLIVNPHNVHELRIERDQFGRVVRFIGVDGVQFNRVTRCGDL